MSKMIKGRSSIVLRKEFPHLKEWAVTIYVLQAATTALWALAGT